MDETDYRGPQGKEPVVARVKPLAIDPIAEARRQWLAHGWADAVPGMVLVTSVNRAQQLLVAPVESTLRPFASSRIT